MVAENVLMNVRCADEGMTKSGRGLDEVMVLLEVHSANVNGREGLRDAPVWAGDKREGTKGRCAWRRDARASSQARAWTSTPMA